MDKFTNKPVSAIMSADISKIFFVWETDYNCHYLHFLDQ